MIRFGKGDRADPPTINYQGDNISDFANSSIVIIPARMHSTRLPRKMLLQETGKPLIQHTYEAARKARLPQTVLIATDHEEIVDAVTRFGGMARMTSPTAPSGTDRIAEVAKEFPDVELIVNVQGDEPEIEPESIDQAIRLLADDPQAVMATLATPLTGVEKIQDPACVKVVFDDDQNALYFSRSPIPFPRDGFSTVEGSEGVFYQHIGLYCYRRRFLETLTSLPPSNLEKIENLEQLRVLQNGFRIKIGVVPQAANGIDTRDDYDAFVKRCLS